MPVLPRRRRVPAGKVRSAVEAIFDRLGRVEAQLLRCRDLNRRAGRGITPFTRCRFLDLELAKAVDRDFVPFGDGIGDRREDGIDGLLGVGLADVERSRDAVCEFGMVHKCSPEAPGSIPDGRPP